MPDKKEEQQLFLNKPELHSWQLRVTEAIALQRELAQRIVLSDHVGEVRYVGGVDMAINETNGMARAAIVVLSYPDLQLVEQHIYEEPVRMPYIPGLLSFREIPCLLGAYQQLRLRPDLIMVDGHGTAHPRRIGIASHLGLWLQTPTIGCGKSVFVGTYDTNALGTEAGSIVPLADRGETIGTIVRTRVKPMIISAF